MKSNIHKSLLSLAVPIESLSPLENNPRVGNVDAIISSYSEFGQIKPIVAKKNEDGTSTVIAGNHQLEAAKTLGWDKIAVVFLDGDDKRAIAYALADNRTMELGYTEPELLLDMIVSISDFYPELLDDMGWDEFEIASYESDAVLAKIENENVETKKEFTAAQQETAREIDNLVQKTEDGEMRIVADNQMNHEDIAIRGSTVAMPGAAPSAAVQVPLVFDNSDQQKKWYKFITWLRNNPSIDGSTTGQKLLNFIDEHCEI